MREATEREYDLLVMVAVVALAAMTCLVTWQGAVIDNQRAEIIALWQVVHQGHF